MIISNLKKSIGEFEIDIPSLELKSGKIHGLLGSNGCGKSSLAKMLIKAMPLDSGTVDYGNIRPQDITLMPQQPYLLQRSVYENIIYPLQIRNIPIDENAIDEYLDRAKLLNKKNQYARTLSSGERQKISFIRSIIFQPKFIIVDETLSNLDIDSLKIFLDWIIDWQNIHKATWLIISHQLNQLEKLCDEVHYMQKGKVLASGSVESILQSLDDVEVPFGI